MMSSFSGFGTNILKPTASIRASSIDDWPRHVNINFHCFNIPVHIFYVTTILTLTRIGNINIYRHMILIQVDHHIKK